MTFEQLNIPSQLIEGLAQLNIITPTEIQEKAIPTLLKYNSDFIGQAQTGTGKTAAFGLPILVNIDTKNPKIQAIILSPTRELAQQIAKQLFKFTKFDTKKTFVEAVYGGEKIEIQIANLKRPTHILVATPGRLIDLLNRKMVDLSAVKTVVLDEADEMLSMGFKADMDEILTHTKNRKNLWLFSATISTDIQQIIDTYMRSDVPSVKIAKNEVVNTAITHQYLVADIPQKLPVLIKFLKTQNENRGIIFCKTKAAAQNLASQLISKNIATDALHGDLGQRDREKVMRAFKNEKLKILIATDVAARGIDVQDLAYIVQYQLPEQTEYYTHRSGRTARAGKKGLSLTFILPHEGAKITKLAAELNIEFEKVEF
ncbi:MAG: DEAD/DEAH box helicase [Sphingobacteriales bacterium]|nr:MAG: DEAD/DEAH box helicase [Sphingobacteriales bacterium]